MEKKQEDVVEIGCPHYEKSLPRVEYIPTTNTIREEYQRHTYNGKNIKQIESRVVQVELPGYLTEVQKYGLYALVELNILPIESLQTLLEVSSDQKHILTIREFFTNFFALGIVLNDDGDLPHTPPSQLILDDCQFNDVIDSLTDITIGSYIGTITRKIFSFSNYAELRPEEIASARIFNGELKTTIVTKVAGKSIISLIDNIQVLVHDKKISIEQGVTLIQSYTALYKNLRNIVMSVTHKAINNKSGSRVIEAKEKGLALSSASVQEFFSSNENLFVDDRKGLDGEINFAFNESYYTGLSFLQGLIGDFQEIPKVSHRLVNERKINYLAVNEQITYISHIPHTSGAARGQAEFITIDKENIRRIQIYSLGNCPFFERSVAAVTPKES